MIKINFKNPLVSLILLLCFHSAAARLSAQEAYKVVETTYLRCDLSEVPPLDPAPGGAFATALRDTPDARGAIVVYGLQGEATNYANNVKERLINYSGVPGDRLLTIYGGHDEKMRMQLWVIPKGAAEPKSNFVEDVKNARKFDTYIYWKPECGGNRLEALAEFAKALKQRPGWHGYIIVRPHKNKRGASLRDEDWDMDGNVSRQQALSRAAKDKRYLVRKFGIPPAQVNAVVGDNGKWTHAELWLVPPGAEEPLKTQSSIKAKVN